MTRLAVNTRCSVKTASRERADFFMSRKLTLEHQGLKQEAKRLAKAGWIGTDIAKRVGVSQPTISRWLGMHNTERRLVNNRAVVMQNTPSYIVHNSPIEEYSPRDGVRFRLIVADPPWAVSTKGARIKIPTQARPASKDFGAWDHFKSDKEYYSALGRWLSAMHAMATDDAWLILWHPYVCGSETVHVARKTGWRHRITLYWCKPTSHPQHHAHLDCVEPAGLFTKGSPRWLLPPTAQPVNHYLFPVVASAGRFKDADGNPFNRAEKPLALLRTWIEYHSSPGDWVLDAFSGSGACAEAAIQIGRNVVAVEAEEAQCKAIEARLLRRVNA